MRPEELKRLKDAAGRAARAMQEFATVLQGIAEAGSEPLPKSTHRAVEEVIRRSGRVMAPLLVQMELEDAGRTDDSPAAISQALCRLEKHGAIRRVGLGSYEWAGEPASKEPTPPAVLRQERRTAAGEKP